MVQAARPGALLVVVAALVLGGTSAACSGPDGRSPGGTPSPTPDATSAPVGAIGTTDCDDSALLQAPAEALAVFPDNPGVEWTARPADVTLGELVLVGLTPDTDEVGYPEFRFVYRCDPSGPARLASYALEEGRFVLLATFDALTDEELPAELEWAGAEPAD